MAIAGPSTLIRLTALGNGVGGGVSIGSGRCRLVDSTITGNDGLGAGFDIVAARNVKLVNTTCDRGARVRAVDQDTVAVVGRLGCSADPR